MRRLFNILFLLLFSAILITPHGLDLSICLEKGEYLHLEVSACNDDFHDSELELINGTCDENSCTDYRLSCGIELEIEQTKTQSLKTVVQSVDLLAIIPVRLSTNLNGKPTPLFDNNQYQFNLKIEELNTLRLLI